MLTFNDVKGDFDIEATYAPGSHAPPPTSPSGNVIGIHRVSGVEKVAAKYNATGKARTPAPALRAAAVGKAQPSRCACALASAQRLVSGSVSSPHVPPLNAPDSASGYGDVLP